MSSVLVLSPHPDDEAIGCGGTICDRIAAGLSVQVIFLTSGEGGGHGLTAAEARHLREEEARHAAAVLGYGEPIFWREPDGGVAASPALVARLAEWLSEQRPTTIYVAYQGDAHPDHVATAELARAAVRASAGRIEPPKILMYEVWTPVTRVDEICDITPYRETKVAAIRCHASQVEQVAFDEAIIGLNRYRGELLSWPEGEYAEAFQRLDT